MEIRIEMENMEAVNFQNLEFRIHNFCAPLRLRG
jgi:hypothetical protein